LPLIPADVFRLHTVTPFCGIDAAIPQYIQHLESSPQCFDEQLSLRLILQQAVVRGCWGGYRDRSLTSAFLGVGLQMVVRASVRTEPRVPHVLVLFRCDAVLAADMGDSHDALAALSVRPPCVPASLTKAAGVVRGDCDRRVGIGSAPCL